MSRSRRRAAIAAAGLALLVASGVTAGLVAMSRADREHARFYATGVTVKGFLAEYCDRMRAAVASGDPRPVSGMYSARYRVPERGAWVLRPAGAEGGADILELATDGVRDYDVGDLTNEVRAYLAGLEEASELECKIRLIEELDPERWVRLTVRYVLAGTDPRGRLLEDRFDFRWRLVHEAGSATSGGWRIAGDELIGGARTVQAASRAFVPMDLERAGIDYGHRRPARLDRERHATELAFDLFATWAPVTAASRRSPTSRAPPGWTDSETRPPGCSRISTTTATATCS